VATDAEQRDTFLSLEEILGERAQRCRNADADLRALVGAGDDRQALAFGKISEEEQALIGLLEAFGDRAPRQLLDTRFQYPPPKPRRGGTETPELAAAQLVKVNHELTESLAEMVDKLSAPEQREDLAELHKAVESRARHISLIDVTTRDP